ncbi:glutaredoxin family protein [Lysobacter arenosi]|uniref:Glutaredoxin family protein n=1 Tax=Lysobacter arenosi TaxID=2795387 RepID=A0ABX7RA40_9GAMM|nr:glutaredoxin family protein [Lysobacter arenosi]QSX75007.1 glutaredoxin family protein [Lysobacter arenosi]
MPHSQHDSIPAAAPALTLFQRDDCHLCDLALEVLAMARVPEFETVFIDDDDGLEQRYGVRVPVLRDEGRGIELDWPFDLERLQAFLAVETPA